MWDQVLSVDERRALYHDARAQWLDSQLSWQERLAKQRMQRLSDEEVAAQAAELQRDATRKRQIDALEEARQEDRLRQASRMEKQERERAASKSQVEDAEEALRRKRQKRREQKAARGT